MPETTRGADGDDQPVLTGERTLPGIPVENYWFQRHVAAYRYAATRVRGLRVLDAGCGEGYGCEILASVAREVVGVDVDTAILRRASSRYAKPGFELADVAALPFPNHCFEAVVSLQVIEHLPRPTEFLLEVARVLVPGGIFILSTPNRLTFSPDGIRNPYHTVELSPSELRALLERTFRVEAILGTCHSARLKIAEALMRRSFPERLLAQPATEWPDWLRSAVARVTPGDFPIDGRKVERALDLLAVARS